jgi:hypothetical protein
MIYLGEVAINMFIAKLYWDARFLMSYMYSNGRPLEEEEKKKMFIAFSGSLTKLTDIITNTHK